MTTAPVFLVEPGSISDASTVTVVGPEARHAIAVMRMRVGDPVDVVDRRGVRAHGRVAEGSSADTLVVDEVAVTREPAPSPTFVLVQALAKGGRDEQAVETAVEFGVDSVVPWQAQRSIVQWRGNKVRKAAAGWQGVIDRAAKQSRRAWVPDVVVPGDSVATTAVHRYLRGLIDDAGVVLVLHENATELLTEVALPDDASAVAVVVGPEGGISPAELDEFVAIGAKPVRLGPHVLRSATAGPAAIAVLDVRYRRW